MSCSKEQVKSLLPYNKAKELLGHLLLLCPYEILEGAYVALKKIGSVMFGQFTQVWDTENSYSRGGMMKEVIQMTKFCCNKVTICVLLPGNLCSLVMIMA